MRLHGDVTVTSAAGLMSRATHDASDGSIHLPRGGTCGAALAGEQCDAGVLTVFDLTEQRVMKMIRSICQHYYKVQFQRMLYPQLVAAYSPGLRRAARSGLAVGACGLLLQLLLFRRARRLSVHSLQWVAVIGSWALCVLSAASLAALPAPPPRRLAGPRSSAATPGNL